MENGQGCSPLAGRRAKRRGGALDGPCSEGRLVFTSPPSSLGRGCRKRTFRRAAQWWLADLSIRPRQPAPTPARSTPWRHRRWKMARSLRRNSRDHLVPSLLEAHLLQAAHRLDRSPISHRSFWRSRACVWRLCRHRANCRSRRRCLRGHPVPWAGQCDTGSMSATGREGLFAPGRKRNIGLLARKRTW